MFSSTGNPSLSLFFDLSKLPALKTIHTDCALYNVYQVHPFDGLSDLLSSSGQSTMMEKIEIAMTIDPSPQLSLDHTWYEANHPGWARLDKALNHLTTLSGFRKLSVEIHFMKVGRESGGQQPIHWGNEWEAEIGTLDRDRFPISFRNPEVSFVCSFELLERE